MLQIMELKYLSFYKKIEIISNTYFLMYLIYEMLDLKLILRSFLIYLFIDYSNTKITNTKELILNRLLLNNL